MRGLGITSMVAPNQPSPPIAKPVSGACQHVFPGAWLHVGKVSC